MSIQRTCLRPQALSLALEPLTLCQSSGFLQPFRDYTLRHISRTPSWTLSLPKRCEWSRRYAMGAHMAPHQVREAIDKKSRRSFFQAILSEGLLVRDPATSNRIIEDALTRIRGGMLDVINLAKKYNLEVEDITSLAIVTYRVPDVQDEARRSRMPPSVHKPLATQLLTACCKVKDPLAIMLILEGVYQSTTHPSPQARHKSRQFAGHFKPSDIVHCRKELEVLASYSDPDAMNLLGQLLEYEGKPQQARKLYEQALGLSDTNIDRTKPRTLFLTLTTLLPVWNALGCLLLPNNDPESQRLAKAAFEKGALEADDPLSYYHLASFEKERGIDWLKYMSKAAASGHAEAMDKVGRFYLALYSNNEQGIEFSHLKSSKLKTALNWLTWRKDSYRDLAEEWFEVAAGRGYKPAMLELVKLHESKGEIEKSKAVLRNMTEPPLVGEIEQWPRMTEEARKRLKTSNLG